MGTLLNNLLQTKVECHKLEQQLYKTNEDNNKYSIGETVRIVYYNHRVKGGYSISEGVVTKLHPIYFDDGWYLEVVTPDGKPHRIDREFVEKTNY